MSGNSLVSYLFPSQMALGHRERVLSGLGAFFSILATTWITHVTIGPVALPFMLASMGASTVLLIGTPHSPLAQPWPFIGGHLISAVIGVTCAMGISNVYVAAGLSVGLSVTAMYYLRCLHPPGGATGLLAVIGDQRIHALGYHFIVIPVMANIAILMVISLLVNRLIPGRSYPYRLSLPRKDTLPLNEGMPVRLGFSEEDLESALRDVGGYIDVTGEDLERIYTLATLRAHRRRMDHVRVGDVMTRQVISVSPACSLEEVWGLLKKNRIKGMPVVGTNGHVVGMVTIADFLRAGDWRMCESSISRFLAPLKRRVKHTAERIMTSPVILGHEDMHLTEAFLVFTQHHINHLPVVNAQGRIAGILTRLDLLAAMYGDMEGIARMN